MTDEKVDTNSCGVFGVEHGGPVIGLGILLILFGLVPFLLSGASSFPVLISVVFVLFGGSLIWLGMTGEFSREQTFLIYDCMTKTELLTMEPVRDIAGMRPDEMESHLDVAMELLAQHALNDADPLTRKHSIYLLGISRNPEFIAVFTSALRDPEKAVRNQVTQALAAIGKPELSALIALLEDQDWKVRYRAVEALGIMKDKYAMDPLIA